MNLSYPEWLEIAFGVPYDLILRPFLFNIYSADLLFIFDDIEITSYR